LWAPGTGRGLIVAPRVCADSVATTRIAHSRSLVAVGRYRILRYIQAWFGIGTGEAEFVTEKLMNETRVALVALAAELGLNRKTLTRWADEGFCGQRLESFRIGKKRFSTRQAAARFLAAVNGEPCETAAN
jgi:hypothetical protein